MIKLTDILQEVLLGEKRAVSGVMNPNENLGALMDKLYKDYGYDKVYVSFRNSKHVGKINPNNRHGTPTGLYTYKLSSYIKTPVYNLDNFRGAFPWATDRKYVQFLVVTDNIVQLNSSTSKGVLDGYVKKIMSMYPNIDPIQGLCKNWLDGSYQSYFGESKNDTHRFWLFLYDVSAYLDGSKTNIFSSLCRKLGIDSFDDDKCDGWIHKNEKCQTVFLRSNLFKDEYVFDLEKIGSESTAVDMKGSSEDKLKWLLGLSREKLIELMSRNVLGGLIVKLSDHIDVIKDRLDDDIFELILDNMPTKYLALLQDSSDKDKFINVLLNSDKFVSNLDSYGIQYLIGFSSDKDKVINFLLNNDTLISNLDARGIVYLLRDSSDKDKVSNVLLNNDTLISNLDSYGIQYLIQDSSDKDKVINVLLNNDTLISNLESRVITYLLRDSSEPEMVMKRLGDKGRELISKLQSWYIKDLLKDSKNKESIKRIFDKYGIDYPKNESVRASLRKLLLR